ncbi:MAG: winged helix-turn-helix transcriptional regulator [Polyangiaceae bacterium]|nr:winged helix-turn-helix transcriptional regulator [Polyangiaceae bacterium]
MQEVFMSGNPQRSHHEFDPVFRALADSTRRDVLRVVTNEELSVMEVVHRMRQEASRSAVSRHLAILREAGLVEEEPGFHKQLKMQLASKRRIEEAFASLLRMWDR